MRWRGALVLALLCCALVAGSSSGAPTSAHVDFTAAGDYSMSATTTGGVLNALAGHGSDAHLALGDLSYGSTGAEDDWCSFVKARLGDKFPFELISGNHESNGLNGNINDFSACMPNQLPGLVGTYGRQYYVDVPQVNPLVRFVMISPNLPFPNVGQYNYTVGTPRYQWVSDTIDGARSSKIPWVVVGMHKPCLSMGEYPCDVGADLANLLLTKKVDLVLTGHEHLYQRSKQLALGPGCPTLTIGSYNPACVVDPSNSLTKGAGTVFATVGTGGVALRDVNLSDPEAGYFVASSGANQNPTYGFEDFDVTADKLTASFLRGAGGSFSDSFTLTRNPNPPPNQPPTAVFTSSSTGLTASLDGSTSTDSDGTIASYAWDFGDGATGTGAKPSHPYAAAGSYNVQLTVTDDDGDTGVVSHSVTVSAGGPVTLVAAGSPWRYLYSATWPGGWASTTFNDAAWGQGPAPLGFGSSSIATNVDVPPPTTNRPRSVLLRRSFDVADRSALSGLVLTTRADDGVVIYVNGQELGRSNVAAGTVGPATYATAAPRTTAAAANPVQWSVPNTMLQNGANTIAVVSLVNYRATPDLSFDLTLRGMQGG